MRSRVLAAILLALPALIAGEFFRAAPPPKSAQSLLRALTDDLRFTYHECVPLGWQPVPVHGTYYPGYTASMQNYAEWLDAVWRGHVRRSDLRSAQARAVYATLNHLAANGLLVRKDAPSGFDYFLTPRAFRYFYGSSSFKDNRGDLPYLCYSTIVPQRIDWMAKTSARHAIHDDEQSYRLQFSWKPSAPAAWADSFIQSHSVVLAPLTSPTAARVLFSDGDWYVENLYDRGWMLPALSAPSRARSSRVNADSAEDAVQAPRVP